MNTDDSKLAALKMVLKATKEQSAEFRETTGGPVTDVTTDWLSSHYLVAAQEKLTETSGEERWEALRMMVRDCTLLRWADHRAARVRLAREKFEWVQVNCKLEKEKEFREWAQRPEIREELFPNHDDCITEETIEKIEEALNLM